MRAVRLNLSFRPKWRRGIPVAALIAFSVASTIAGARALMIFDSSPGLSGVTPARWPASSRLHRASGRPEMLIFVHQYCPCTSATIDELARVPAKLSASVPAPEINVLFCRTPGATKPDSAASARPSLWQQAQSLARSRVLWDDGGAEARRFGARVSGYVVLYNAAGDLLFQGGVTGSRGHEGDNYGLDSLVSALDSGRAARGPAPVFGCALGIAAATPEGTSRPWTLFDEMRL